MVESSTRPDARGRRVNRPNSTALHARREVRAEQRKVERDIREVEVEQKKMQANIRDAAKRWDARLAQDVADRASRAPQLRPLARAGTTWDH